MELKLDRQAPTCRVCGHAFADGEALTTALRAIPKSEDFERHDICGRCWPKQSADDFTCFWQATHTTTKRPPLLDADVLWQVFLRAVMRANQDPQAAEFAYVAALGLLRLRQCTLERSQQRDGAEWLTFKLKGTRAASYDVRNPNLDDAGITRVQESLGEFAAAAMAQSTPESVSNDAPNSD